MPRVEALIFEQARLRPEAPAVADEETTLTYAALADRARAIGAVLRGQGVGDAATVGVWLERNAGAVAAFLGVWDAGGVVVPLSLDAPPSVLEQIVGDAGIRTLVTTADLLDSDRAAVAALQRLCPTMLVIGPDGGVAAPAFPAGPPPVRGGQGDACYIYYTSGSRGRPKGVEGLHRSLVQYLDWQAREFAVTPEDRFSQVAPLTFDFCLKEIFVPLIRGASVHLASAAIVRDPERLLAWIGEHRITTLCCVPSLFRPLTRSAECRPELLERALASLRLLLISGDLLRWEDVRNWRGVAGDRPPLVNLYGPTESTVIKLFYRIPPQPPPDARSVPVGRPIDGAEVLICDERGTPCPDGETGEIVIVSDWIARGYRGGGSGSTPAFTTVRHNGALVRAYRSGDLGRRLADGNVEISGRGDRQVKVRGHRVELDGIEAVLAEAAGIDDLAVVTTGAGDARAITCFYTGETADPAALRAHAAERMLPHAVPARFVRLAALPLSTNGKVDRLALAEGRYPAPESERGARALTALETQVLALWRKVLEVEQIGVDDNFFDVGGNSISAITLLNGLRHEIHPEIDLTDVFEHPTVAAFCAQLAPRWGDGGPAVISATTATTAIALGAGRDDRS
jgi:amino acid adenylation domain-containing protein